MHRPPSDGASWRHRRRETHDTTRRSGDTSLFAARSFTGAACWSGGNWPDRSAVVVFALVHVEADTANGTLVAATGKGKPKTWSTLDASARWLRGFGVGIAQLDVSPWQPAQRALAL